MDGVYRWICDARLDDAIQFDQMDVDCERASGSDGSLIIAGSCRLVYSLKKVHANDRELLAWLLGAISVFMLLFACTMWVCGMCGCDDAGHQRTSTENESASPENPSTSTQNHRRSTKKRTTWSGYHGNSSAGIDYPLYLLDGGDSGGGYAEHCDSGGGYSGADCGGGDFSGGGDCGGD